MNWSVILATVVLANVLNANITFNNESKTPSQNAILNVQKVMPFGDLSGVNLRVEGATFRKFNLYLTDNNKATNPAATKLFGEIRSIIDRDLLLVGTFNFITMPHENSANVLLLKQKGVEGISSLNLTLSKNIIHATVKHKNLMTGVESTKNLKANLGSLRLLSHQIAQSIYEQFIGPENLFMLQIAAVKRERSGEFLLVLIDFDGQNETVVAGGKWQKTSTSFSPDGKSLLYAVNTPNGQGIVEQNIGSKQFQFRIKKPGLNIDPQVMPDNSGMLVTLSFEGDANIYRTTRMGTIIAPLTRGLNLNLTPAISPDGKEFAFVSDRDGTAQIYVQSFNDPQKKSQRITHKGKYNQTPCYSPDGKLIAITGRDEEKIFDIFLIDRQTERLSRVTQNQGRNEEPKFLSGRFIIFTSIREGKSKPDIFISSLNGSHQFRLTDANNNKNTLGYYSPVVRPK